MSELIIIGGGLAGSEAAWQAAEMGVHVVLYEMRPAKTTPAHKTAHMAELLCSNSLRSNDPHDPAGLLKEELRRLDSLIIRHADTHAVPAGKALAVDREQFARSVTRAVCEHSHIRVVREEAMDIPPACSIIATGPLTSDALSLRIEELLGKENFYFYDAIAPIIDADSIDYTRAFFASRYDREGKDYLNCPLTKEEYDRFYDALTHADKTPLRAFEEPRFFEGCIPIEETARRGRRTLTFGPMRPVGIEAPDGGERPYAVVQLRREDSEGNMFNIVGFQTHLKQGEQRRVFRMIPGLEKAEILRYGSIHRNSYINSPDFLCPTMECRNRKGLFFAGQITGVEGYVESVASGYVAGTVAAGRLLGREREAFPDTTAIGSLIRHITTPPAKRFQPMNINLGLFPPLVLDKGVRKHKKREKKRLIAERSLRDMDQWILRHKW